MFQDTYMQQEAKGNLTAATPEAASRTAPTKRSPAERVKSPLNSTTNSWDFRPPEKPASGRSSRGAQIAEDSRIQAADDDEATDAEKRGSREANEADPETPGHAAEEARLQAQAKIDELIAEKDALKQQIQILEERHQTAVDTLTEQVRRGCG